jgi:hypothetical protein
MSVQEIQVYVVEVCRGCGWNHLVEQFLLGRATLDPPADPASGSSGRSRSAGARSAREAAE